MDIANQFVQLVCQSLRIPEPRLAYGSIVLLSLSVLFLTVFLCALLKLFHQGIKKLRQRYVLQKSLGMRIAWVQAFDRLPGIPFVSRLLISQARCKRACERVSYLLELKGFFVPLISLCNFALAVTLALGLGLSLITRSPVATILVMAAVCVVVHEYVHKSYEAQAEAMLNEAPEVLRTMSSCLQAGMSVPQLFYELESRSGALSPLFAQVRIRLDSGLGIEESLEPLRCCSVQELSFVALALQVQHQSGGAMKNILDAAEQSVYERFALRRSLRVQTAQARFSARIISCMPFILLALFSLVSPDFLSPFFESIPGLALLLVGLTMQLSGVLVIRRLVTQEVLL